MGIACSMSNILQAPCGTIPPPPPVLRSVECPLLHVDDEHGSTWIIDELPAGWVTPVTVDWGDGTVEVSVDEEEAHEYDTPGVYLVVALDSAGAICEVEVTVPAAPHSLGAHVDFEPGRFSEAVVEAFVDAYPGEAPGVLAAEQSHMNRPALVAWLIAKIGA